MKIYMNNESESLEDIFRRMIISAKTNVKIYYPYKDMVFVAERITKIEELRAALDDPSSRWRLDYATTKKFFRFWKAIQEMNALNSVINRSECRNNKEWRMLYVNLHSAYDALGLGGRQGANFIIHYVSNTKNTRTAY